MKSVFLQRFPLGNGKLYCKKIELKTFDEL